MLRRRHGLQGRVCGHLQSDVSSLAHNAAMQRSGGWDTLRIMPAILPERIKTHHYQ
jgi:hypothetical protein